VAVKICGVIEKPFGTDEFSRIITAALTLSAAN